MSSRHAVHAHIAPRRTRWPDLALAAALAVAIVALIGWAQHSDAQAGEQLAALLAGHSAYQAGEQAARDELTPRIAAAYGQGWRDALRALQGRPEALALAQACAARSAP